MEPYIRWRDDWLMGIEVLDNQHRLLADILNRLVRVCQAEHAAEGFDDQQRRETLGALMDELYRQTSEHFTTEESMMKREAYPGYASHAREHKMLLAELKSTFSEPLQNADCGLKLDIIKSLKSWFVAHVSSSDRQFAGYMRSRSPAAPRL